MRGIAGLMIFAAAIMPALAAANNATTAQTGIQAPAIGMAIIAGLALFLLRRRPL